MSSVNGKWRRGTLYKVSFPTLATLDIQPRRVELLQSIHTHEILTMEFTNAPDNYFQLLRTGVPVQFEYSQGTITSTFFGVVSTVTKRVAGQRVNVTEVTCIGSTFSLKERKNKTYYNTTIPEAVHSIVSEFGFNFIGEPHPVKFDQLSIAGHSYWEWIQEYAKKIGYGVVVIGMDFIFKPLDKIIDQNMTNVPVLSFFGKEMGINSQIFDRTLDSFEALNGEHVEYSHSLRTNKTVGGVDPISSTIVNATSSPKTVGKNIRKDVNDVLFNEVRSDQVVTSHNLAKSMSDGAAHNGRLNTPARVKCQGDPRIRPYAPVYIQGTGTTSDGYWICKEIKHMFAYIGDYQIEMTVYSDGLGPAAVSTLRQGTVTISGVVNLTEALKNGGKNPASPSTKKVTLKAKTPLVSASKQGFKRTPVAWTSKGVKGHK
jgi:phage protein D